MTEVLNRPARAAVLTFSVEGLPARDELLVKSFVRLLKHRTAHEWLYQAQPADLRMVAEGVLSKNLVANSGQQQQALVLGSLPNPRPGYLCMPLRADELQHELDRLGALIVEARPAGAENGVNWNAEAPARLLRWPPADLVATPQRMRLATLLTGKPLTLNQLHRRSGQPEAECGAFLNELLRAGLLAGAAVPAAASAAPAMEKPDTPAVAPTGLLSRIRNRLSLFTLGKS